MGTPEQNVISDGISDLGPNCCKGYQQTTLAGQGFSDTYSSKHNPKDKPSVGKYPNLRCWCKSWY